MCLDKCTTRKLLAPHIICDPGSAIRLAIAVNSGLLTLNTHTDHPRDSGGKGRP